MALRLSKTLVFPASSTALTTKLALSVRGRDLPFLAREGRDRERRERFSLEIKVDRLVRLLIALVLRLERFLLVLSLEWHFALKVIFVRRLLPLLADLFILSS